jgi:multicomponent Na+:H+ antiporter subunit E
VIRWLGLGGWLTVVWVALWGDISFANILSGIAVATVVLVTFPLERDPRPGTFRPVAALRYVAFFAWQLVTANAQVAWEVLTPRNRENEGIICMPVVPSASQTLLTLIVNTIGLTPGTMVIDLTEHPRYLYVHVLHLDDVDDARANLMRFQDLAVRAFGSADAIAELDQLPHHPTAGSEGGQP